MKVSDTGYKLQCLVVDDEPLAREVMEKHLVDIPWLQCAGSVRNAIDASAFIKEHRVDLLLLDIRMPGLTGIQFIRSIIHPPLVIFTTAYPEYAVDGFEVDAVDYLVKPISFARFFKAVEKARERFYSDQGIAGKSIKSSGEKEFIMVRADKRDHRIQLSDILVIESMGDYLKLKTTQQNLLIHCTLKKMLTQLSSDRFIQIHRSSIIALAKIDFIEDNQVHIGEHKVPIGEGYRKSFLERLGN